MSKYIVEGFLRVKLEVEADSEEEALEVAEEEFDFDKNVDTESLPEWQAANEVEPDEDEDDAPIRSRHGGYDSEEDDD
jgi:hypothetical protein